MADLRFVGVFLGFIGVLTVVGGALAIVTDFPGGGGGTNAAETPAAANSTGTAAADPSLTPTGGTAAPGDPTSTAPTASTGDGQIPSPSTPAPVEEATQPAGPTPTLFTTDVQVEAPRMELPTQPLMSVEATYTEVHTFGKISVAFRPGAYTAEHAAEIAAMTEAAMAEANQKLGTSWNEDLTVYLADQLFAEDCIGCQGFTESDFRWIFMLDDGSVVRDEFEALLVHEMAHLIAGNEIHDPLETFYVEGLATWVMTDDLLAEGYVSPLQTTAWVRRAGALPSIQALIDDDYAGRMRKRVYYDASAAFAFFVIERYGYDKYLELYRQAPMEAVLGKPMGEVEAEWHAYLDQFGGEVINGADAAAWWDAAAQVIAGFERFYENPSALSAEQYRLLTLSRLALNRAEVPSALHYLAESGV